MSVRILATCWKPDTEPSAIGSKLAVGCSFPPRNPMPFNKGLTDSGVVNFSGVTFEEESTFPAAIKAGKAATWRELYRSRLSRRSLGFSECCSRHGRQANAQPLHPKVKCGTLDSETSSRSARSAKDSVRRFKGT